MDDVEECREPVDIVELARQSGGEIEAEPVDVHLDDPVAKAVHDELQRVRIPDVETVPRAGDIEIEARILVLEPVVGGVVDAAKAQRGTEMVALAGVVVDDVEDHLESRGVQRAHHRLELAHLFAVGARRRVASLGREVADRVVAPVVDEVAFHELRGVEEVMHGHQLDRGHADAREMFDGGGMRQPGVGAAQRVGDIRVSLGESLDVQLVDDRVGPRRVGTAVVAPGKRLVDDHAARHRRRGVDAADAHVVAAEAVPEQRAAVAEAAGDGASVRIEQQLGRVVAQSFMRRVATVHAEPVALTGADVGDVSVPHEVGSLDQRMGGELGAALVEEHEVDRLGALRKDREVGARSVPGCAERSVGTRPGGAAAGRASGGGRLWNSHDSTQAR